MSAGAAAPCAEPGRTVSRPPASLLAALPVQPLRFLVFRLEIPSPEVKSSSSGELHLESEERPPSGEVPGRRGPERKAGDGRAGHPAVQGRGPDQTMSLPRV